MACPACQHTEREAIDRDLRSNMGLMAIAKRYGIHHLPLRQHYRHHLKPLSITSRENSKTATCDEQRGTIYHASSNPLSIISSADATPAANDEQRVDVMGPHINLLVITCDESLGSKTKHGVRLIREEWKERSRAERETLTRIVQDGLEEMNKEIAEWE